MAHRDSNVRVVGFVAFVCLLVPLGAHAYGANVPLFPFDKDSINQSNHIAEAPIKPMSIVTARGWQERQAWATEESREFKLALTRFAALQALYPDRIETCQWSVRRMHLSFYEDKADQLEAARAYATAAKRHPECREQAALFFASMGRHFHREVHREVRTWMTISVEYYQLGLDVQPSPRLAALVQSYMADAYFFWARLSYGTERNDLFAKAAQAYATVILLPASTKEERASAFDSLTLALQKRDRR